MTHFNVGASFTKGKSQIPGTIFKGNDRSLNCSVRNVTPKRGFTKPMAVLSFSIGKGLALFSKNVRAFGKVAVEGKKRYLLELERPAGSMVMEYEPATHTFFHTCQATAKPNPQGVYCYHMFQMVAAIVMYEEPHGELAEHFREIDFSQTVTDEKNFFIASDALYFDAKEYDGAVVEPYDPNASRIVIEDLTPAILQKDGIFTVDPSFSGSASSPTSKNVPLPELVWNHAFSDEEEANIQENNEKMIGKDLSKNLVGLGRQIQSGEVNSVLFIGDAGTGKTTAVRLLARDLNAPVYIQNMSLNSEELDIIGGFVPAPGGGFEWKDGLLVKGFRNGGFVLFDEINFTKPGVLGVLNNVLDGVGQIVLRNGEVVKRHPNFRFFGAMNVGTSYTGTQRMNVAFINRFKRVLKFEEPDKERQVRWIIEESGYNNRSVVEKMVEIGKSIKQKIKEEQIDGAEISIRNLINWATEVKNTQDILNSSYPTVVWSVCYDDEDVQKEIFEDIIQPRFQGVSA